MLIDDTVLLYHKFFECFIIFLTILFRVYLKLRIKLPYSYTFLNGKTAVITGANRGIGYETALDLAKRGAKVILACRNEEKAKEAVKRIIYETENDNVTYKLLDLESFKSVRKFAEEINTNEGKVDILINNAGIAGFDDRITEDGNQITMQVNYLAPFLLIHLLMDSLMKCETSRIVNVSSHMAKYGKINESKIDIYPYGLWDRVAKTRIYCNSKLCLIYFTEELARKLQGTNVTVNVLHPGAVQTDIFRRLSHKKFVRLISKLWFKTPEEGSRTTIYLATSPDVEHVSGKMFDNCTEVPMTKYTKNPHLGQVIFNQSEDIIGIERNAYVVSNCNVTHNKPQIH